MMQRVVEVSSGVIDNVTATQLSEPTLCTEWTVRDLINHMVGRANVRRVG